jgi:hypothetical protein
MRWRKAVWRIVDQPTWRPYAGGVLLLQTDPTGMSTPLGQVVIAATLIAVIALAIRFFWQNRK